MIKNRQTLIKIIALVAFVVLVCVLAFVGTSKFRNADSEGVESQEMTEVEDDQNEIGVVDETDEEPTHADILDKESEVDSEGEQILYFQKDEVYGLSITDANGILLGFEKQGDKWIYTDDTTIEIKDDRIDKILNYLCDIRVIDYIETTDEEAEGYGLTQESPMYIIKDKGGNNIIISLGNIEENGNIYFAFNYDFSSVYVNQGKLANVMEYSVEELVR